MKSCKVRLVVTVDTVDTVNTVDTVDIYLDLFTRPAAAGGSGLYSELSVCCVSVFLSHAKKYDQVVESQS
jgi:hypothetical protein